MSGEGGRRAEGRTWETRLTVECANCGMTRAAAVAHHTAFGGVEGCKRILRYLGWTIDRRNNHCPNCSGPIPKCPACGALTPEPYAMKGGQHYNGGHPWTCHPCQRKALRASVARYTNERMGARS